MYLGAALHVVHACQALLSYSLIIWVCLRITLVVVYVCVKVNIMLITLQNNDDFHFSGPYAI